MQLGTKVKPVIKPTIAPKITHSQSGRGKLICLLGKPGMGKTSLAAEFPNPYFITDPTETGIIDLVESGAVNFDMDCVNQAIGEWIPLLRFNDDLYDDRIILPSGRKTLVYESLSGFEKQCIKYCCDSDFNGQFHNREGGYHFFGKGDRNTGDKYWPMLMAQFLKLVNKGYNVILTGHTTVANEKNPKGSDYMVEQAKCSNPVWGATDYVFPYVFFLSFDVEVEREGGSKFARPKALENADRVIWGYKTPFQAAKNRCRMTALINKGPVPCETPQSGFASLCKATGWHPETLRYVA